MKILKLIVLPILIATLFSFETAKSGFIGKFGTSYDNSQNLLLEVNNDFTFHYKDFTDSKNKIDVVGTWKEKGNKIVLTGKSKDSVKFHNEWKLTNNGKMLKAHLGLCFYTIARLG